jgi:hypothetical protein
MPAPPSCPRCGYELSGRLLTLESADAFPLADTCTECGLEYAWADVFGRDAGGEQLHFERALAPTVRSFLHTLRRLARPGRFWRWTRMEWPLMPGRLACFSIFASVLALVIPGVIGLLLNMCYYHASTGVPWRLTLSAYMMDPGQAAAFWPFGRPEDATGTGSVLKYHWVIITEWSGALLLMVGLVPIAFELAPVTKRRFKIRRRHLVRVLLYQLPVLCVVLQLKMIVAGILGPGAIILNNLGISWAYRLAAVVWHYSSAWEAYGFALTLLLSMWWWYAASRWYLKLPRPGLIALGLVAVAALASLALCSLVPGLPGRMLEQIHAY